MKKILLSLIFLSTPAFAFSIQDLTSQYPEFDSLSVNVVKMTNNDYHYGVYNGYYKHGNKNPATVALSDDISGEQLHHTFIHEVSHAVFFQKMSNDEQLEYCKVARVNVSKYAATNCSENFAETVAVVFYGRNMWNEKVKDVHRSSAQYLLVKKYLERTSGIQRKEYRKKTTITKKNTRNAYRGVRRRNRSQRPTYQRTSRWSRARKK